MVKPVIRLPMRCGMLPNVNAMDLESALITQVSITVCGWVVRSDEQRGYHHGVISTFESICTGTDVPSLIHLNRKAA